MMRKISFIVICIYLYNVLDMYVSVYIYMFIHNCVLMYINDHYDHGKRNANEFEAQKRN